MINILTAFITLFLITGASAGYSTLFIRRKDFSGTLNYSLFSIVLGGGFIAGLTLLFSVIHYINLHYFITVAVIGNALLLRNRSGFKGKKINKKIGLFLFVILIFLVVNFFYSLFPPTFYDSMMYHLAVPNYYMLHGGIVPWDNNFNASLPLNGEMIFLFSLLSGTVFTPKLLSLFYGIIIIILLTQWYRESFGGRKYFLPGLLFLTIPQISFLMSSSKTDIIGMLFMLMGIRSFFYYKENRRSGNFLVLSGVFWGLAIGTKYIFAFYLVGFFLSLLFLSEFRFRDKHRSVIKISLIVLLCMAPWFMKNIVTTGNPVYPYLGSYFGSSNWDSTQGENFSTIIKRGGGKTVSDYLKFPLNLLTKPYSYGITAVWGFMFLIFLPFSLFNGNRSGGRVLLLTSLFSFILLLPFAMVPRYFLSSLLLISIPVSLGIERAIEKIRIMKSFITPVVLLIALLNLILLVNLQEKFFHGFSFLFSKYSGEHTGRKLNYLYALPYYGGVEYINEHLSDHDLVAFLGEDRTFYMNKMFIASSFNDKNVILEILKKSDSFFEFKMEIELKGITHIYYSPAGRDRMGNFTDIYSVSTELKDRLESWLLDLTLLYRDKNYFLYKLGQF